MGEYDKALSYLKNSIELKDTEDKHHLLANIYTNSGNIKAAVKEYNQLIKEAPNNIEYTIGLTNIYIKQHKYIDARKVLKTYAKNNPSDKNNPRFESYGILNFAL